MPTALLVTTQTWVPTARLGLALAGAGFRVEAVFPAGHPLERTGAARRIHRYRGLGAEGSIARAITAANPDLIVPGDDLAVRHLHEVWRREAGSGQIASAGRRGIAGAIVRSIVRSLGPAEWFGVTQSRAAFMDLARAEGVRVPETEAVASKAEIEAVVRRTGLPAVYKADASTGGEGVRVVRDLDGARAAFDALHAAPSLARAAKHALLDRDSTLLGPALRRERPAVSAQAFVEGHEATSAVACWGGEVLAGLHFEVLRKTKAAGHATVVRRIDEARPEYADMAGAAEKIARRMGLSGLCGFDFMVEAGTGRAYLIEINPRATQVGHLNLGPGRNLAAALYAALTGEPESSGAAAVNGAAGNAVTDNETIALFPHEWARDPGSEFLRSAYHDVPWETPELVYACVARSREQSKWYGKGAARSAADAGTPDLAGSSGAAGSAPEFSSAATISAGGSVEGRKLAARNASDRLSGRSS